MTEYEVGDELVFDVDGRLYIEKITHITKTGRMKVTGLNFQVLPDLKLYGEQRDQWGPHYRCLGKPTDAHRKKVVRQNKISEVLSLIRTFSINGISDENLDKLLEVLKNTGNPTAMPYRPMEKTK
jgi:hypothetical protein